MAKGNMFLGMARGKVGDVVFYRADGQQLSRVRNRNPRNPRSDSQLYQRAIMATIVQAYTAGKAIFDHSFQGYSVGAQNQREFLKRNAKLLREAIAADINNLTTPDQQIGRVVAPKSSTPVPFGYVISSGSYDQNLFTQQEGGIKLNAPLEGENISAYAERNNLIAGDIYTIVAFVPKRQPAYTSNTYTDALANQQYCDFMFVRLTVKPDLTSTEPLLNFGQLFSIETSGAGVKAPEEIAETTVITSIYRLIVNDEENYLPGQVGAYGVIRSRKDMDLRSNTTLSVLYGNRAQSNLYGIASYYLLDAWQSGTQSIGDSPLILEGGDI